MPGLCSGVGSMGAGGFGGRTVAARRVASPQWLLFGAYAGSVREAVWECGRSPSA